MFNPNATADKAKEKNVKKQALKRLEEWCKSIIPVELHEGILIDIQEVICGDPECAPVDTVFYLMWTGGHRGVFALPAKAAEVTQDELIEAFPDAETMAKWKAGIKAPWPPLTPCRFSVGDRVECRIGPHPVKGLDLAIFSTHTFSISSSIFQSNIAL